MKTISLGIMLLVVLAGAAVAQKAAQHVAPVVVWQVALTQQPSYVQALGTLRANEGVVLTVKQQNIVQAIHFTDNQRVNKGDLLVELRNREQQADVAAAQSQFGRIQTLAKQGVVAESVLDERRRDYAAAKAQLADHVIKAPFAGVVGLRNVSVGGLVQPGTVMTTLDDDSVMKLDFQVPEMLLEVVHVGQQIEATADALAGQSFVGTVSALDTRVDPVTRTLTLRAELANPEHVLRAGMMMRVSLATNPQPRLMMPEEALLMEADKAFVLVLNTATSPTTVSKTLVTTGLRVRGLVEITDGLASGQQVVTHGVQHAVPGQPVQVLGYQSDTQTITDILRHVTPTELAR